MSNGNTSAITKVAMELIATPNGQIRLAGAIMCIGPGYYILTSEATADMFSYAMLGVGFLLILVSAAMAVIAAKHAHGDHND